MSVGADGPPEERMRSVKEVVDANAAERRPEERLGVQGKQASLAEKARTWPPGTHQLRDSLTRTLLNAPPTPAFKSC